MTDLEMKGKVSAIDTGKCQVTMKDELGVLHIYQWTEVLDVVMRKWKVGYYLDIKYDADTYLIKSATYWQEGKDVFPKDVKAFQKPRNERLIVTQMLVKTWSEVYIRSKFTDVECTVDFDIARRDILQAVEEDIDRVMRIGGDGK
jgi:hypothetical protein